MKASNAEAADKLAGTVSALAIGDGVVAVSATQEDSNATGVNGAQDDNSADNSGAVYVYRHDSGNWRQEAYLKASNTEAHDGFGSSVALSGDTLAIAATGEDSSGEQSDNSLSSSGAV